MKYQAFAALIVIASVRVAAAESASAKAEALFREGRDLMTKGKLAEACAAFDASQKLEAATTTVFNQGDCREKNAQLATAWGLFVEAERQTRAATDDVGTRLHAVAVDRAAKLERRISKLTISVPDAARVGGLVILRAGTVVEPGEWNHALPVDGGSYAIVARSGQRDVWSATVVVGNEGEARVVTVQPDAPVTTASAVTSPPPTRSQLAPKLTTVSAALLLGGSLAFELWGDSIYSEAKANHDPSLVDAASTKRYVAEGLLVAGVGCAAVSVYLWLHDSGEFSARPSRVVTPVVGAGFAGVQLDGRW